MEQLKKLASERKVGIAAVLVVSTLSYLGYKIYRGDLEDNSVLIKEVGNKIIIEEAN